MCYPVFTLSVLCACDTTMCNLITRIAADTRTSTPNNGCATDVSKDEDGLVGIRSMHEIVVRIMSMSGDMFLRSPESGHVGARMHGSGSSQKSLLVATKLRTAWACKSSFQNQKNQVGYFFGRPRPPEQVACTKKFFTWDILCLKESGWGPPPVRPIHGRWCLLLRCKRQLIIKYSRVQNRLKCQFPLSCV